MSLVLQSGETALFYYLVTEDSSMGCQQSFFLLWLCSWITLRSVGPKLFVCKYKLPRVRNSLAHQIHGDLWSSANTITEGKGHCKQSPCVTPFIRYRMHERPLDRLRKLLRWNTCEWLSWRYQSGLGHQHLPSTAAFSHGMEMNVKPEETLHFIAGDNISSISRLRSLTFLRMAVFIPFSVASVG